MIQYTNIQRINDLDFDQYLQLPGLSNSFLKGERFGTAQEVEVTDKIKIGKYVDAILTDPGTVDMLDPLYSHAKNIAYELKKVFGPIINKLEKQVSYTAEISYGGYSIITKARLDFLYFGGVIDLKITSAKDIPGLIKFMRYEDQLWHYSKCSGKNTAYLMVYSIPLKKPVLIKFDTSSDYNEFWANKILKLGQDEANVLQHQ